MDAQRQNQTADRQKIDRHAERRAEQHEDPILSVPNIEREEQTADQQRQRKPEIQNDGQTPEDAPQTAQQIVMQSEGKSQGCGKQELPALQAERKLHSAEQTVKKAACLLRLLIGQRIHAARHGHVAAVDGERFQVQTAAPDD